MRQVPHHPPRDARSRPAPPSDAAAPRAGIRKLDCGDDADAERLRAESRPSGEPERSDPASARRPATRTRPA